MMANSGATSTVALTIEATTLAMSMTGMTGAMSTVTESTMTDAASRSAETKSGAPRAGTRLPARAPGRAHQDRVAREAAARRAVFALCLGGFVAAFALIATAGKPAAVSGQTSPPLTSAPVSGRQVIAEVPISDPGGSDRATIVRIVAPQRSTAMPHARTRAS
jgi:hypothetical protein